MIRLIRRRLIIPRGDTGSFSIPTLGKVEDGDLAVFGIFDPLTHETKLLKMIKATNPILTFTLKMDDTINLAPKKYNWDITIYHNPITDEDGILIGAEEINSYYSAYKLPICEIKEIALDMYKEQWNVNDLVESEDPSSLSNYIFNIRPIYPWENIQLSFLTKQLYTLAQNLGFGGNIDEFESKIKELLMQKEIEYLPRNEFPEEGNQDVLYFSTDEKILYYWENGYFPVNATLIVNSIITGGGV